MKASLFTSPKITSRSREDASWLLILALCLLVALFQVIDPFSLDWRSAIVPAAFVILLSGISTVYRKWRPTPALAATVTGLQQMILFTCLGACLSYMVAAHGGVLWDATFQQWDEGLGLNWLSYLAWTNAHPLIGKLFSFAYSALIPQMIVIIIGLGFSGKIIELRIVVFAAILAGTVTVCISGLTPAMSNFVYLGLEPADYPNLRPAAAFVHVNDIEGLRSGLLRTLSLDRMQGIITFPSYHAALATVFVWGFYRTPYVKWAGVSLSVLTIAATPIDGGHYFVDVLAGIAIATASIWLGQRYVVFDARPALAKLAKVRSSPCRRSRAASAR